MKELIYMYNIENTGLRARISPEEQQEILNLVLDLARECKDPAQYGKAVADLIFKRKLLTEDDYNIVSGKI